MATSSSRILTILELLQSQRVMAGSELARRLGVDIRTVRRYVAGLDALGIPVVADRGRDGGYRLLQGFKLPPMLFNNDEGMAIALGLVAAKQLGIADSSAASESALAKLERVMPDKQRKRLRALSEHVSLDLARAASAQVGETLAILSSAAHSRQRVRLLYRKADGDETTRDIDPYGVALLGGYWYVVGFCHLRQDLRSFRIDRIVDAQPVPASFGKPEHFDAVAFMTRSISTLPRAHTIRVRLATTIDRAQPAIFAALGVLEATDDGTLLHCQADDLNWIARELARLPFRFQVDTPNALRKAIVRHAAELCACAEDRFDSKRKLK